VAVAQEDETLEDFAGMPRALGNPPFDVVADLKGEKTARWDRITTYLIDRDGIVRQVFPTMIRQRPSWKAILREVDVLNAAQAR
jgi:hypothetical protein